VGAFFCRFGMSGIEEGEIVRRSMAWILKFGEFNDSPFAAISIESASPKCVLRIDKSEGVCRIVAILAAVLVGKSIS
jgi:hypothetical protein